MLVFNHRFGILFYHGPVLDMGFRIRRDLLLCRSFCQGTLKSSLSTKDTTGIFVFSQERSVLILSYLRSFVTISSKITVYTY